MRAAEVVDGAHPGFHIYHFAPYEPAALKRLMGRHATREEELDRLLRAERFVDLHGVVRQGLRVGVERYSLKDLEVLHAFPRTLDLREASAHLRRVERALELGDVASISTESRGAVEQYNREDCLSAWSLRGWLERVRKDAVGRGAAIPRPELAEGEPPAKLDERQQRLHVLVERLTTGVPADRAERSDEQQARWLLGHLLEWHRREDKATWWEYFRLRGLTEEQLLEERAGIGGLSLEGCVGGTAKCPIHRYRFPAQDHDVRAGKALHAVGGAKIGEVAAIDPGSGWIDIKKRADSRDTHPTAVFVHDYVDPEPMPGAIERLANWVIEHGIDAEGANRAARDTLLRRPPRLAGAAGGVLVKDGEDLLETAKRLALELDGGVLPVQGPPGAGKTFTGARMICALVRQGKKVGITAVSHKVIRNLLDETLEAAASEGLALQALHKVSELSATLPACLSETKDNKKLLEAIESKAAQVIGATPWAWARPDFQGAVDVLVVDEAGQMALANAVAAAGCATSVILLGDPQQLEQPIQGSHPEGTDVCVLQHLLGAHETLPSDRGLFLAETWRLHPKICAFTSEAFYEGRLVPRPGCEGQRLVGCGDFDEPGLWLSIVEHEGNQSSSPEEADRVADLARSLLREGAAWTDREGKRSPLTRDDILVVAPYNAQVALIAERLPGFRVGTVDKFQGQEAPVVIYSMTTSSAEEAPRGMEFLYSLHRLNVATSRAKCAAILVASPRVFEPECRTPHQMRLANALCRYAELARRI